MRLATRREEAPAKGRFLGIRIDHIVVLLTLPVIVFLAFSAGRKALETYALKQEAAAIQTEIDGLRVRNAELRKQIEYLRSDAYVERVAREELDLVKPGDVSFVVTPVDRGQPVAVAVPAVTKPSPQASAPTSAIPWRDPIQSSQ